MPSDEAYIDVESEEQLISELKKIGKSVIIQNKNYFGKNIPEPELNGIEHYYLEQVCIREERYGIVSQYYTREYMIIHEESNMSEVILSNKTKDTLVGRRISGMSYGCDYYNIFFMVYHKPQENISKSKED